MSATLDIADLASPTTLAPEPVAPSAAELAARIPLPLALPARLNGEPLRHLSHSSVALFASCARFCAPVLLFSAC